MRTYYEYELSKKDVRISDADPTYTAAAFKVSKLLFWTQKTNVAIESDRSLETLAKKLRIKHDLKLENTREDIIRASSELFIHNRFLTEPLSAKELRQFYDFFSKYSERSVDSVISG